MVSFNNKNSLTKAELIQAIIDEVGLPKEDVQKFVELFFESLTEELEKNNMVKLTNFGTFSTLDKSSRPGRNPKTGEEVEISARRVISFRASQKLKSKVNE